MKKLPVPGAVIGADDSTGVMLPVPLLVPSDGAPSEGNPLGAVAPRQADHDVQVIEMWLHGRSQHTQRAYAAAVHRMRAVIGGKLLMDVTVRDLQALATLLEREGLAPASRKVILSAIRSLFTYAHGRIGYLPFNVGGPLEVPKVRTELAERILTESQVHRVLACAQGRDGVLLRLLYSGALRRSELCALRWRDVQERGELGGQVTVFGKGGKTRPVLLSVEMWRELVNLREHYGPERSGPDDPVFRSRKRSRRGDYHLDPSQVRKIVVTAARRAGIEGNVSPHWLRHSHASHALDRGAPIHIVQHTLGHSSMATTGAYTHVRPADSSSRYLPV